MRKALLAASMLALVGCSEMAYRFNSDELHDASAWGTAGVPFDTAKKYEQSGIGYDTYAKFSLLNVKSIEEIKKIARVFPLNDMTEDQFKESKTLKGLNIVIDGLKKGDFTLEDVASLLKQAEQDASLGLDRQCIIASGADLAVTVYPIILTSSARNIHRGQSPEEAIRHIIYLTKEHHKEDQKISEQLDKENQPTPEEAEQQRQQWASTQAYLSERGRIQLQEMGMLPEVAEKGIWAAMHKPNSPCAYYIRQLTADADMRRIRPDFPDTGGNTTLILRIQRSNMCTSNDLLEKSIVPPETALQKRNKEELRHSHYGSSPTDVDVGLYPFTH